MDGANREEPVVGKPEVVSSVDDVGALPMTCLADMSREWTLDALQAR